MTIQATGSYVSYNKPKNPRKKQSTQHGQLGLSRRVSKAPIDIQRERAHKTQRFEINKKAIETLQKSNSSDVRRATFFHYQAGGSPLDEGFQKLFEESFVFMRGKEALVREGAYKTISSLDRERVDRVSEYRYHSPGFSYYKPCYSDVYDGISTWDNSQYPMRAIFSSYSSYFVIIRPTKNFRERLGAIVNENGGLFRDFLILLKQENRTPYVRQLGERENNHHENMGDFAFGYFRAVSRGYTLGLSEGFYPRIGDRIKEIYSRLLAIKWLEQDQQRLAGELRRSFIPKAPSIFLPEQYFPFEGKRYVIYPTLGDGACALHALLGEQVSGEYRYRGSARKAFTDALKEKRDDPHIQQLFLAILKSHIDNVDTDPSSQMLFANITDNWTYEYILLKNEAAKCLRELKNQEASLWVRELEKDAFKEKFLEVRRNDRLRGGHAAETEEQVFAGLRKDVFSVFNTISCGEDQFVPLLDGAEQRKLFSLRHTKEQIEDKELEKGDEILLSDKAFHHYLRVVQNDDFWFNTQEIELASHLFDKKTQLFSIAQEGENVGIAPQIFNPDLDVETTYIFHHGEHFCRVRQSNETTLSDLIGTYIQAQQKAEFQIKRDVAAQNLLMSTAKQELCQIGFSGGISFLTWNPIAIGAQVVKSANSLSIAYLDPFRDTQISRRAEAIVLPVFQLASGNSFRVVATSFVVDQGVRKLFDMDKEETGVEAPEWLKRLVIYPIAALADKNPAEKIVSGLFGAGIKGGMDSALHKWEEHCGIDQAYWINDPSWGQCIMKAGFTNDAVQELMNLGLMKAIEKPEEKVDDAELEEAVIPEVVYEILFPDGSHLLGEITGDGIGHKFKIQDTYKKDYNEWSGKYEKFDERNSVIYVGENQQKRVDDLPNKDLAQQMINIHNQAHLSYIEPYQKVYAIQQALVEMGIPPEAIPAISFKEIYVAVNYPPGDGKAKCYINGEERKDLEVKGKHKGSKPLENVAQEVNKNKNSNDTALANYLADINARFGVNIETSSSGSLNLLTPYVTKQEDNNYKVIAMGLNGETLNFGKSLSEDDARALSQRLSTLQSETIDQQRQCIQMERQLIEAGVSDQDRPQFPTFETLPTQTHSDVCKNFGECTACSARNRNATNQYLASGNQLLETPFQPQAMTRQERNEITEAFMPTIEKPDKEHGFFFNAWRAPGKAIDSFKQWCDEHGVSIDVSIGTSIPLYETKSTESYNERQMQRAANGMPTDEIMGQFNSEGILVSRPNPQNHPTPKPTDLSTLMPPPMLERPMIGGTSWNWQSFQAYQNALTMQTVENAIEARSQLQLPPPERIDLNDPNKSIELAHRELWGPGVLDRDVELKFPSMQKAGFSLFEGDAGDGMDLRVLVDNDFVKTVPKGWGRVGIAALKLLVPDMSDIPGAEDPHAHLDMVAHNVGRMYDEIVHIEDPNSFAAKAGTFVGECMAISPVFKITRLAQLPGVFCAIAEGGTVGAIFAQADNQSPLEGALLGGAIGGGLHKLVGIFQFSRSGVASLLNRAEPIGIRPLGDEAAFLRGLNAQMYRSGFVSEGTVARLTDRQIRAITPLKLPSVQVGEELTWLSNNLPKIRQIQQVKGMDRFDQYLKQAFRDQNLTEMQVRRILNYSGFETYPRPIGLPENVVVELSKKNGGMTFRLAGTTTDQNLVVRVCPGLAKESMVSSVLKGNHLNGKMNGTFRQQTPYVVQRRGKEILTQDGRWLEMDRLSNKDKALTHIPLEIYEFKGW